MAGRDIERQFSRRSDGDTFLPASRPADNGDRGFGNVKQAGYKAYQVGIGLAIGGRGGQAYP